MDLKNCQLFVDGKPVNGNLPMKQGAVIELLLKMAGGAKGSRTSTNLGIHSWRERQTPFQGDGVSSDDEDRRSLFEEPISYELRSEDSDTEQEKENSVGGDKNSDPKEKARSKRSKQHLKRALHSKRKKKSLSLEAIDASMKEKCCKENCISSILTKEDVVKNRKQFRDLSEEGQRSFILNFFLTNQCFLNGRRKYTFRVNCKKVCRAAWMKAYSISPTTFYRLQREFEREGRLSPDGARKGRIMTKQSTLKAEAWLQVV